jgi:amino acid transporter
MNLKAPRGIIQVALGLVLALIVVTAVEVTGVVALRGFAILCLVAMIIAGVAFIRVFKRVSPLTPAAEGRPRLSERKRWYVLSAAFLWVVLAFWLTRGGPLLPRLVGSAVVIALVAPLMLRRPS